jgi:hypothetical protein
MGPPLKPKKKKHGVLWRRNTNDAVHTWPSPRNVSVRWREKQKRKLRHRHFVDEHAEHGFCLELKVAAVRLGLIRPTFETSNWHLWHLKIFKRSIIANYVDRDLVRRWKIDWRSARIMTLSLSNDFQSWLGSLRPLLTSTHKAYVDRANTNGGKSNVQIKITASSWHDSVSQLEGDKVPEAHRGNFPKTLRLSRTNMFSGC